MNRKALLLVGGLIVMVALITMFNRAGEDPREDRAPGATSSSSRSSPSDRLQHKRALVDWSPAEAAHKLRELKEGKGGTGWSFGEVTSMVQRLTDVDLRQLVQEVGLDRTDGMQGWVRAALFAEWSRRDFEGAMAFIAGNAGTDSGAQQALYAIFRGSRPGDPLGALLHLEKMFVNHSSATGPPTRQWAKHALREIFGEWARIDSNAAWKLINGSGESEGAAQVLENLADKFSRILTEPGGTRWIAMEGFFGGLPDHAVVQRYAQKFKEEWNAPEAVAAIDNYRAAIRSRNGWAIEPPHEAVARAIGRSFARFDFQVAAHWITVQGPGDILGANGRLQRMWREWAQAEPAAALDLMRSGEFDEWNETLATSLMRGDARLATHIAEEFGGASWMPRALLGSFPVAATMDEADLFPVPDAGDQLPDHRARYEVFQGAIEISRIQGAQLQRVLQSLHGAFRNTVEEAAAAHELLQRTQE